MDWLRRNAAFVSGFVATSRMLRRIQKDGEFEGNRQSGLLGCKNKTYARLVEDAIFAKRKGRGRYI